MEKRGARPADQRHLGSARSTTATSWPTKLIDRAVEALGAGVASAVNLLDVEAVIIGGGLGCGSASRTWTADREAMQPHLFVDDDPPQVRLASLGDLGGAIGASLLLRVLDLDPAGRLPLLAGDRVDDDGERRTPPVTMNLTAECERQQVHAVRDRADHERAEQRRPDRAAAAEEAGAGDHRAGDREQQQVAAARLWLTASRREAARMPPIAAIVRQSAKTMMRIAVDADAGPARGLGVAADGEDVAAEAGALGDVLHADHEADQDQDGQRDAAVGVEDRDGGDHRGRDDDDPDHRPGRGGRRRGRRPGASPAQERDRRRRRAITTRGDDPADGVASRRCWRGR